jgi:phosphoglycolate phosphatase
VISLICFDLDGTLVDSSADIHAALTHALDEIGPPEPARAAHALGRAGLGLPLEEFFALACPDGDHQTCGRFIDAYRRHYHAHLLDRTRPFPGVEAALAALAPLRARGLRTVVATTKKTDTARRVVTGLGLDAHFDAVLGTDGIPHKPAPDLLYLAARTVGRAPSAGLMVGDTDRDLIAGRRAGMKTCGVTWGVLGHEGLLPHGPDYLIDRFSELVAIVRELADLEMV